jgi:hypothetical protein
MFSADGEKNSQQRVNANGASVRPAHAVHRISLNALRRLSLRALSSRGANAVPSEAEGWISAIRNADMHRFGSE